MIGIFGALICVLTMVIAIPIPATKGFINIGDLGVMIAGLLLGPVIGGIAGGVGSALADLFLGYVIYAPATLIIKGLEGFIIGVIANPRKNYQKFNFRDIIAVIVGGLIMVFGYFIYELILFGFPAALFEFFLNSLIQFVLSAIIALIFTRAFRKKIIDSLPEVFEKVFIIEIPEK
ncbi:MAG: ECF transporter S component [Promethearchaeota archaeon]|nr:MAG: ECF transporter S component [Candidatus Lokiarchaeota archaeon]